MGGPSITQPVHEDVASRNFRRAGLGVFTLVRRWGNTDEFAELRAERTETGEADKVTDLGNRQVGCAQEILGPLYPPIAEVLRWSFPYSAAKLRRKWYLETPAALAKESRFSGSA